MKSVAAVFAAGVLACFILGTIVHADDPVKSHWRPDNLRIDGLTGDWPVQTFVSKEVAASVVNDAQAIYILVVTADPKVNTQLTRAGLAVYLDPKGGRGQGFGVRIPPIGDRLEPGNAPAGAQDDVLLLSYFDVLGPGDDESRRVELPDQAGIDLRIASQNDTFFLELKVPFALPGITLDKTDVGLGIVTPDPQRVVRPSRGGGGGFSGLGVGPPPRVKGKALNIWTKAVLVKAPSLPTARPIV